MTIARSEIIQDGVEGTYHCISRCVRRAFLCGFDKLTGKNYDYRKKWIDDRLEFLESIFAIDVSENAILDNHLHLILRNRPDIVSSWSNLEVAQRWRKLYPKKLERKIKELEVEMLSQNEEKIEKLRSRLQSISWFMKSIKEYIALKANKEDGCTGRFWEGRFKSIDLADEQGILSCMVYVDLNPIRANIAKTPEESDHTSIQKRIIGKRARARLKKLGIDLSDSKQLKKQKNPKVLKEIQRSQIDKWLSPISYENSEGQKGFISMSEDEYIALVDFSGRAIVAGKMGTIPENLSPIFERLKIDTDAWLTNITKFGSLFCRASGSAETLSKIATRLGKSWIKGLSASKLVFAPA